MPDVHGAHELASRRPSHVVDHDGIRPASGWYRCRCPPSRGKENSPESIVLGLRLVPHQIHVRLVRCVAPVDGGRRLHEAALRGAEQALERQLKDAGPGAHRQGGNVEKTESFGSTDPTRDVHRQLCGQLCGGERSKERGAGGSVGVLKIRSRHRGEDRGEGKGEGGSDWKGEGESDYWLAQFVSTLFEDGFLYTRGDHGMCT